MNKSEIYRRCNKEAEALLDKYFHNNIHDAAISRPETLEPEYNGELPHKIEAEFGDWLANLWKELKPQLDKPYNSIMNRHLDMVMTDAEYSRPLTEAKVEAEKITLWEKICKSNHEDVTYYKSLLMEYTRKLLDVMISDFLEDLND